MFGGGVAGSGTGPCGAIMGGLMAISMKYGDANASSSAKARLYEIGRNFMDEFMGRVGSSTCEGILGINISNPESFKMARSQQLFETKCLNAVQVAAELLEKII